MDISKDSREKIGEAYSFFDCRASKEEVARKFDDVIKSSEIPRQRLELSLFEGERGFLEHVTDSQLKEIVPYARRNIIFSQKDTRSMKEKIAECDRAKSREFGYVIHAAHLGKSNVETAQELSSVVNGLYQSPLYEKYEPLRGVILYKDEGEYIPFE